MIDTITQLDSQLLLALNSLYHPILDTFMYWFSSRWVWVPLYLVVFLSIMRYYGWKAGLVLFLCTVAAAAFSDQLCATVIRPVVARLRPAHLDNPISPFVHIVGTYRGGGFSFPSCHAANTFAFATIITLALPAKRLMVGLYSWAIVTCYSRIYLGVHYPVDLLVGALIGILAGILFYTFFTLCIRTMLLIRKRTLRIDLSFITPRNYRDINIDIADLILFTIILTTVIIAFYAAYIHFIPV